MKIVFATNNSHKVEEVEKLLPDSIQVLSLKDIQCSEDIEETAETLEGNARIKSDFVKINYEMDCFADDTGLEVEVLNGGPGVYSARFAGDQATYEDNVEKLLRELEGQSARTARFRTVISLNLYGKQYFFEGICDGVITKERAGEQGFGYDPVFKPNGYEKTFAEMEISEKGEVSHRGKAVRKLVEFLRKLD